MARLRQCAPAANQSLGSSACDLPASWYPNSVAQEGQISNDAAPVLSYGGSARRRVAADWAGVLHRPRSIVDDIKAFTLIDPQ
jgi:hypothetical protein